MIVRPVLCRPFVGRRDELAYLHERRLEAASSHGGLVLIAGDAGLGKSRLIAQFRGSLGYARWRTGQGLCIDDARRPYGPILDALAQLGADGRLEPAATKQEQLETIARRVAALAARGAILLVVEDLHWADAATLDVLAHLGTAVQRMRVLIVASFRPDELHPEHPAIAGVATIERVARAGRIDLAPLSGVELRTFIDEALDGVALPEETRRAVALAGEGNPFFTEELLKSAVEQSRRRAGERASRELPMTVRAALLERLRPFDEGERRVIRQAAAIGRSFGVDLLAATTGASPGDLLATLRRARDFQLVEEAGPAAFRFRHGLTREAVYRDFLAAELRPMHRDIALALERRGDDANVEALAYHWWAAGAGAESARYNERAGDAAGSVHAHEDAIAFYERALESEPLDPLVRAGIAQKIADRRGALNATEEAYRAYVAAADGFRAAGAPEREAACRLRAAIVGYTLKLDAPTQPLEEMLERLPPEEYVARSRVHLGLAWLTATLWYPTRAAHHLAEVDARALDGAPDVLLRFRNVSAWVAMTRGELDAFRREHAAWVAAARATGSVGAIASAHYNGAMCFAYFGLHDDAREHVERALAIARDERSVHGQMSAHAVGALCAVMRGDLDDARRALEHVPASVESRVTSTIAAAAGALAGAYLDDPRLIATWFDGFAGNVSAAAETECAPGFAEILVRRGRFRDAEALVHRALPECECPRGMTFTLLAAGRYGTPRDAARARTYLARAADAPVEIAERHALSLFDAEALRRAGRDEEAVPLARAAADGFRRLGFPLLEAAALESAGDPDAALAVYRRCGALFDVRRLEALSAPAPRTPAPRVDGEPIGTLSSREREIALLAAEGRSNVEIARGLCISYKTVEKHLGSVYQKLGITSRAQLAAFLAAAR
ncbi:MAG TPA: AAA family ATPase [Candidatus Baltobacteraceae bacterium]|nr:AAA family ATPase [Candidatus Baltobacteraceae bacterium]